MECLVFHFPPEFDFNVVVATEAYNNQCGLYYIYIYISTERSPSINEFFPFRYFIVSEYELTHNSTSYALSTFNLSDPTSSPTGSLRLLS